MLPLLLAGLGLLGAGAVLGGCTPGETPDGDGPDNTPKDNDGDGYVAGQLPQEQLATLSAGRAAQGAIIGDGDCNDNPTDSNAPNINPGATDTPNDGVDQDCDGSDASVTDTDTGSIDTDSPGETGDTDDTIIVGDTDSGITDTDDTLETSDTGETDTIVSDDTDVLDTADTAEETDGTIIGDTDETDDTLETADTGDTDDTLHTGDTGDTNIGGDTDTGIVDTGDTVIVPPDYDLDDDGYDDVAFGGLDCDDSDATINPSAGETPYDGIDNDCDVATRDDDLDGDGYPLALDENDLDANGHYYQELFADFDGDGHTAGPGETRLIHEVPAGYATARSAIEDVNDFDGSVYRTVSVYTDVDGDGYTSGGQQSLDVGAIIPTPYTETSRGADCDDTRAAVNPGVPETVYNGLDDDCNVATRDDDLDADGYALAADCDDTQGSVHPGAAETVDDGVDQDCNGADLTRCDVLTGIRFDGQPVIINMENRGDSDNGALFIHAGNLDGTPGDELVIGAPNYDIAKGRVYAFINSALTAGTTVSANTADVQITGGAYLWGTGGAITTNNTDGDAQGKEELYLGISGKNAVLRVDASTPTSINLGTSIDFAGRTISNPRIKEALTGPQDEAFGQLLMNAGDVDGDGIPDMLMRGTSDYCVIAPIEDNNGFVNSDDIITHQIDGGYYDGLRCGAEQTLIGDVTADGIPDLVFGDSSHDLNNSAGNGWIIQGASDLPYNITLTHLDAINPDLHYTTWAGGAPGDSVGLAPSIIDIDGDDHKDLFLGGKGVDNGHTNSGANNFISGTELGRLISTGFLQDGDQITTDYATLAPGADYNLADLTSAVSVYGDTTNAGLSALSNDGWSDTTCDGIGFLASGAARYADIADGKVFITPFSRLAAARADGEHEVIASAANGDQVLNGPTNGNFGSKVKVADLNGDNVPDLIVTAPGYDNSRGRVYIYYGREERTQ